MQSIPGEFRALIYASGCRGVERVVPGHEYVNITTAAGAAWLSSTIVENRPDIAVIPEPTTRVALAASWPNHAAAARLAESLASAAAAANTSVVVQHPNEEPAPPAVEPVPSGGEIVEGVLRRGEVAQLDAAQTAAMPRLVQALTEPGPAGEWLGHPVASRGAVLLASSEGRLTGHARVALIEPGGRRMPDSRFTQHESQPPAVVARRAARREPRPGAGAGRPHAGRRRRAHAARPPRPPAARDHARRGRRRGSGVMGLIADDELAALVAEAERHRRAPAAEPVNPVTAAERGGELLTAYDIYAKEAPR